MRLRSTWLIALAVTGLGISANADSLVGTGAWQTWSAASTLGPSNMPTYGGPYWNNFSGDGNNANIGWCMTGTGGCAISSPPGAVQYYGNSNNAVQNMSYQATGVPVTVSLLGALTNQKGANGSGTDYFGWYSINSNGTLGATHSLWNSTSAVASTATFAPTGRYGFYFENVQSPGKSYEADYFWFMNSGFDYATGTGMVDTGVQHFSVFSSDPNGVFYMGLEDQRGGGDLDYNDMIIKVVSTTPEPASLGLLLAGVGALRLISRKKRTQ